MKRIIILALTAIVAVSFATAQADSSTTTTTTTTTATSTTVLDASAPAAPAADAAAPEATPAAAASEVVSAPAVFGQASTDHYVVLSEMGQDRAVALSRQLEALFGLYDGFFRYDPEGLKAKLSVREFRDKASFDIYMTQIVGQSKDDFVYLHYPSPERSELLVFPKDEPDFSASLAHQGFVQFLKAFVPNPPLWIREGVAVSFESAVWDDAAGRLSFPENLAWLETVKSLKERSLLMGLDKLLSIGQDEARAELDVFYPQAWALASFLTNSEDKAYNRLLWDSVAALKKDASLEDNQAAVAKIVSTWYGSAAVETAFAGYLADRKTFPELVADGVRKYADKSWEEASAAFSSAKSMNQASYVPDYYLGLIAYAQNQFDSADAYYKQALALGCDPAITNYALGVNAYAQNRLDDAKGFLVTAKDASPDRYGEKVDSLIAKIGK
jgi:tetratricopeptide (TPR) repeat protein